MLGILTKKFNKHYFKLNILSVLIFATLYYLQDSIITNYHETAVKYGLLREKYSHKYYSREGSGILYYLWYSLITQTTVGYAGTVNSKTGMPVPFTESPNRVFKFINMLQLLSVLVLISIA